MRVLLPVIFILFITPWCRAQSPYDRGTVYLAGETTLSLGNFKNVGLKDNPNIQPVPQINGLGFISSPVGIFAFDRLLVGARLGYAYNWYGDSFFDGSVGTHQQYQVSPFIRYYLLAGGERKWNLFAEAGYGTLTGGSPSAFLDDFHLGAGVDVPLLPGVVGTARLTHYVNEEDVNRTVFDIRGNQLLGQIGTPTRPWLTKGSWTTRGGLASFSLDHMRRDSDRWINHTYSINPSIGYFLADGLLVSTTWTADLYILRNVTDLDVVPILDNNIHSLDFATELETRYYPWRRGKLLPFIAGALGYEYYESIVLTIDNGVTLEKEPEHSVRWRAAAGMSYFLGQHVALEVSAAYQRDNSRQTVDGVDRPAVKFRHIALQTGFAFYFGGEEDQ